MAHQSGRRGVKGSRDLVPVNPVTLRQALADKGWSLYRLAKKLRPDASPDELRKYQQTLAYPFNSNKPIVRISRSTRNEMARALGVPLRIDPRYADDWSLLAVPNAGPLTLEMAPLMEYLYDPATEVAAMRYGAAVLRAIERDFPSESEAELRHEIWSRLLKLLQVGVWRHLLTRPRHGDKPLHPELEPVGVRRLDGEADPTHKRAILNLILAMRHMLEPWIAGRQALGIDNLRALTASARISKSPEAMRTEYEKDEPIDPNGDPLWRFRPSKSRP